MHWTSATWNWQDPPQHCRSPLQWVIWQKYHLVHDNRKENNEEFCFMFWGFAHFKNGVHPLIWEPCRICVHIGVFLAELFSPNGAASIWHGAMDMHTNDKPRNYRAFKMLSSPLRCPSPKGSYFWNRRVHYWCTHISSSKSKGPSGAGPFISLHVTDLGHAPIKPCGRC